MPPKSRSRGKKATKYSKGKGRGGYRTRSDLHAPKKFCCLYKVTDVIAPANGLLPDGIRAYNLKTKYTSLPINAQVAALYRQVALTGVKVMYRTTNPTPNAVGSGLGGTDDMDMPHPSVNCFFVEDKDTENDLTATQFRSQDNVKRLVSHRNFSHYIRNPRPALYQQDGAGNRLKVIDSGNQIHWISTNSTFGIDLMHLHSQFAVEELPATVPIETGGQKQGEIWLKVYFIAKEQNI